MCLSEYLAVAKIVLLLSAILIYKLTLTNKISSVKTTSNNVMEITVFSHFFYLGETSLVILS